MFEKYSDKKIDVVTFESHEHRIVTDYPMKEYGVGLDHMAEDDPYLACKLLFNMLASFDHMMPNIVTTTSLGGYIKSELDGDSIVRNAFLNKLHKTIQQKKEFTAEVIIVGYFLGKNNSKRKQESRISQPDYAIDLSNLL
jgi:hypothetical protein